MNYTKVAMLVNKEIRAVTGIYDDNQKPTTFKTLIKDLKVDDVVVVESTTRHGYTTVKIKAVDVDIDFDSDDHMHWVVCRVPLDDHAKIKHIEEECITLVRKGELRKRREDILKNTFDAATNEEMSKLEIASLGSNVLEDGSKKTA